jgi:hypothetical protein
MKKVGRSAGLFPADGNFDQKASDARREATTWAGATQVAEQRRGWSFIIKITT